MLPICNLRLPTTRTPLRTHASYGGYRSDGYSGGDRGRQGPPSRGGGGGGLILPGRDGGRGEDYGERGRLYVPGTDNQRSGPLGGSGLEGERSVQNFRPPQGFMDRDPDGGQVRVCHAPGKQCSTHAP